MNARQEAYTFLTNHKVAVLSTANKQGEPWGAAIYFIVNEALDFFFLTHAESKKYQNLKENQQASIVIASDDEQATVQALGRTIELSEESDEFTMAFRMLATLHPPNTLRWTPPVSKLDDGRMAVMKMTPSSLQFSTFNAHHRPPHADVHLII